MDQSRSQNQVQAHGQYLDTLKRPSSAESRRISDIQVQKEFEIDQKYHTAEQSRAATTIQKAYRGHRERRQLEGFTLDPSSRWVEIIKEMRFRGATAPHYTSSSPSNENRSRAPSDLAKLHWRRVGQIAERAGAGERIASAVETDEPLKPRTRKKRCDTAESMLMDLRYFLEMVDQRHRYGANLQIFHKEWLREKTDQNFFQWLDHGDGRCLDLPYCPREKLDKERIRYLSRDERRDYLVKVDAEGRLRWDKDNELVTTSIETFQDSMHGIVPKGTAVPTFNDEEVKRQLSADASFASKIASAGSQFIDALTLNPPVDYLPPTSSSEAPDSDSSTNSLSPDHQTAATHSPPTPSPPKKSHRHFRVSPATILNHLLRASVKPGTFIYVSDTVGRLYVGIKSSGAFQHTSFLSGARIFSAGAITIEAGKLTYLSPLSGHYRPTTRSFRVFLENLKVQGVDLSELEVSMAYRVLVGMEIYGKTKRTVGKVLHVDKEKRETKEQRLEAKEREREDRLYAASRSQVDLSATELVERNWKAEHRT